MTPVASGEPEQFVSIVIRAYHGGRNLFRTLESCASLDYDRRLYEVIVVRDWDDLVRTNDRRVRTTLLRCMCVP